jgi:hypothetical protein
MKRIVLKTIATFLRRWKEYLPLTVALMVWIVAGPVIRLISPTSGTDDAGLIQALLFGLVLFFAACAFSWFALRTVFPSVGKYVDDEMGDEIGYLADPKTKIWVSVTLFAIYFLGAIIVLSNSI